MYVCKFDNACGRLYKENIKIYILTKARLATTLARRRQALSTSTITKIR